MYNYTRENDIGKNKKKQDEDFCVDSDSLTKFSLRIIVKLKLSLVKLIKHHEKTLRGESQVIFR